MEIQVDTQALRGYAERLRLVNVRLRWVDQDVEQMRRKLNRLRICNLLGDRIWTGYEDQLLKCRSYLQDTANSFEKAEERLLREDPAAFEMIPLITRGEKGYFYIHGEMPTTIPALIKRMESEYKMRIPRWAQVTIEELTPQIFQDMYNFPAGILKGEMGTAEMEDAHSTLWVDFAVDTLNPYLLIPAGVSEFIRFEAVKGKELREELKEDVSEQIEEGDILGAQLDLLEYGVDHSVCRSLEAGTALAGKLMDSIIGKAPFVGKVLDGLYKYDTGKSPGEWVEESGKSLSKAFDKGTDLIVEGANVVTDAITDTVKTGCHAVHSLLEDIFH